MNRGTRKWGAWIVAALAAISAPAWASPAKPAQDAQAAAEKDKAFEIGTVTITFSGLGRRNRVTVIRYRKSDLTVVGVVENGKDVPPEKFERYKRELEKALEYPRTRDLLSRLEDLEKTIKRMDPPNREQRLELDKLLDDLSALIPKLSPVNKSVLAGKVFEKGILALLQAHKFISPDEEVRLVIRKSKCEVNGHDLPPDVSDEIFRLWEISQGTPLQPGERVTIIFDKKKEAETPRHPL